ncbi:uncharacterized protein [Aristolochia californica]|uniref:uncharacterized protein isoform X1 n=1 Tax=Aristolochia californica TaxID=171875 RepID=UPI0035E09A69
MEHSSTTSFSTSLYQLTSPSPISLVDLPSSLPPTASLLSLKASVTHILTPFEQHVSYQWLVVSMLVIERVVLAVFKTLLVKTTQSISFLPLKMLSFAQNFKRQIPGVPLIYGLRNSLFLEPPSTSNRQYVKSTEEERLHVTELECEMLNKKSRRNLSVIQPAEDPSDASEVMKQPVTKDKTKKKPLGVADKVRFKRNKAKGPNPLSVKKKSRAGPPVPLNQGGEAGKIMKKRNRKRSRKNSNSGESYS